MKQYLIFFFIILVTSCSKKEPQLTEQEVALAWADMTLYITQHTPANSPTYASRALAYIGLTMYESIVPGYENYNSVALSLNKLGSLPTPEQQKSYNWVLSLNAAQAEILKGVYNQTSDENKQKIDSLELEILSQYKSKSSDNFETDRSILFGKSIAKAIFDWSKTDGGHRAYLNNFDKEWKHLEQPGAWQPPLYAQSFSHHPLHPHWGENRTFLAINSEIQTPIMIPFNPEKNSPYYQEFLQVYEKDKTLTKSEKEAAIWWGDDPDESFTPPGHSYYFASLAVKKSNASLIESAATFAKLSLAVADSFRNCWKWKYHFFSERPNTFIPKYIDENFESFWPDPPFPAFPSGHAINAGAAATVLSSIYGDSFSLIDSSHVGRKRDEIRDVDFVPRSFDSFWQMANETANSRFYGGIHTSQDNEVGLAKGKEIAENVLKLSWTK